MRDFKLRGKHEVECRTVKPVHLGWWTAELRHPVEKGLGIATNPNGNSRSIGIRGENCPLSRVIENSRREILKKTRGKRASVPDGQRFWGYRRESLDLNAVA